MARSNYTPQQLIDAVPACTEEKLCADWFADVMRWADIERAEDIKNVAWHALETNHSICSRDTHIDVLLGKLRAFIKIYCIEQPVEPDLNPSVPTIANATHTISSLNVVPGSEASNPVLP